MFRCSACACKDAHINTLRDEIQHLRTLVYPAAAQDSLSVKQLEADHILSGEQDVIAISEDEMAKTAEKEVIVRAEADAILSGNY